MFTGNYDSMIYCKLLSKFDSMFLSEKIPQNQTTRNFHEDYASFTS